MEFIIAFSITAVFAILAAYFFTKFMYEVKKLHRED